MTMDSRAGTISMPPGRCAPPRRRVIVELTGRGSGGVPTLPALVETARSQRPGAQAEPGWRGLGRHVRFGFLLALAYPDLFTVPSHSLNGAHHHPQSGPSRARSGSASRPFAQRKADHGSTLVGAHGNRRATTRRQTPSGGWKAMNAK